MNNACLGGVLTLVLAIGAALAETRSGGNSSVTADEMNAGGQRLTSANYTMDGSLGGIAGVSSNAACPAVARHGYIGQLTEVTLLAVVATPSATNEGQNMQLSGVATLDDDSVSAVPGSSIVWISPVYPITAITPEGLATVSPVYSNTWGSVTGAYLGVTGPGIVLALDSNPDNFGLYAGDQVPDGWQVACFGVNNPLGVAGATNATGQNNLYTYVADLNPNDPSACFRITAVTDLSPNRMVCFGTTSGARSYRLLYTTNLVSSVWTNLPGTGWASGIAGQMSLPDTNAASLRFYRVEVVVP